ncbi:zinc finger A20 and AN1 domain-containing stress-associated protein 6-like [Prosopis cineraria]|uniref:zinc finger A20 and AN1 domain-containing stress-associated protein 6-like n=1 Tax=Prosopis cineraria TaxID=364024 RepID=UPI00240EC905|nr:zinc finger A20 and AN1 domain-containing stress-associated protein 6-like [Prosopis cineraria]
MDPPLCSNGCGFFGSQQNQNMCSKCYKDHILKLNEQICESMRDITVSSSSPSSSNGSSIQMNFKASLTESDEIPEKKRCKSCNKKVGVTGFTCRCGDLFCGKHRYPEEHSCTVDYKQIGRELIEKQNPICRAHKHSRV